MARLFSTVRFQYSLLVSPRKLLLQALPPKTPTARLHAGATPPGVVVEVVAVMDVVPGVDV